MNSSSSSSTYTNAATASTSTSTKEKSGEGYADAIIICRRNQLWKGCTLAGLAQDIDRMPGWCTITLPCQIPSLGTEISTHQMRKDIVTALSYLRTGGVTTEINPNELCDLVPLSWIWAVDGKATPLHKHYGAFLFKGNANDDPRDEPFRSLFPVGTRAVVSSPCAIFKFYDEIDKYVSTTPEVWNDYMDAHEEYGQAWNKTVRAREYSRAKDRSNKVIRDLATAANPASE